MSGFSAYFLLFNIGDMFKKLLKEIHQIIQQDIKQISKNFYSHNTKKKYSAKEK